MVEKYMYLSHFLSSDTPTYGNRDKFEINKNSSIENGDTANSHSLSLSTNHMGTHIDLPNHFYRNGQSLNDFKASYWFYNNVGFIELPKKNGELIIVDDLLCFEKLLDSQIEILIIKTGFEQYRKTDIYWQENPGVDPSVANYLIEKYPNIRTIGFDFISLTSFKHRSIGKEAHLAFLNPKKPITVIEDMHLEDLNICPSSINVLPLLVQNIDSAPVNVIAIH